MKKFFVLFFVLFFALNAFAAVIEQDAISVQSTSMQPSTVYPGDAVSLQVTLSNNGSDSVDEVNLDLSLSENFEEIDVNYSISRIRSSQTVSAIFSFRVKDDAQVGTYSLPLQITYFDDGRDFVERENVTFTVSEINKLAISEIRLSNTQPHIEEMVTINATVKNIGSELARQVLVSLEKTSSTTFGNFITLSPVKLEVEDIGVGEETKVVFKIKPGKKISPGTYSFDLNAACLGCSDAAEERISFEVLGKPELILSGIDFSVEGKDEKKIVQGDTFSLSVQLDNIGKEQAKAVEISVELDDAFSGARKSYIGTIDEDDSGSGIFDFSVTSTATIGLHPATVVVEYIDEVGRTQQFSEEYEIYINAAPPADISVIIILLIILLAVAYFFVKMVFRQLAMRRI